MAKELDWNRSRLTALRESTEQSQSELAVRVGATKEQITAWESDPSSIPNEYAEKLGSFFGVTVAHLRGEDR